MLGYVLIVILFFVGRTILRKVKGKRLFVFDYEDGFWLFGVLAGCFVLIFILGMVGELWYRDTRQESVSEQRLVSLRDQFQVSGNYAIIFGNVSEKYSYSFYVQGSDGGIRHQTLSDSEDVVLYKYPLESEEIPRIEVYKKINICPADRSIIEKLFVVCTQDFAGYAYSLHVPEGTVQSVFVLDQ